MKKSIFAIVLLFTYLTSAYAIFDSKKIKELEQENTKLKSEVTELKNEIKKMKAKLNATNKEEAAIATVTAYLVGSGEKVIEIGTDKVDLIKSDFDLSGISPTINAGTIYSNLTAANNNNFSVEVVILYEVTGTGDKENFVFHEETTVVVLKPNEIKTVTDSFYISLYSVDLGDGISCKAKITKAVKY